MTEQKVGSNGIQIEGSYIETDAPSEFEVAFARSVSEGLELISDAVAPILRIFLSDAMSFDSVRTKSRMGTEDAKPLQEGLEKILGFGAKVFEKKILTNLQSKLGLNYELDRNFEFSKEVERARKLYIEKLSAFQGKMKTDGSASPSVDRKSPKE